MLRFALKKTDLAHFDIVKMYVLFRKKVNYQGSMERGKLETFWNKVV